MNPVTRSRSRLRTVLLRAGGLSLLPAPLAAQDTTEVKLERVTITATRAPVSAIQAPLAVSVIGPERLRTTRGYGLDEALSLVPGVLAQSRYGNQDVRITIRGFGARGAGDRSNAGTSRGIRVLLDGIPETEPDGRTSFDGIDLASSSRIDVVRSNASALWGNAAGGVISVSTIPTDGEPALSGQQMAGSFGLFRTALRGSLQSDEGRQLYASLVNSSFDGWRQGSSSRRSLLNAGAVAALRGRTGLSVFVTGSNNLFHVPGPLTREQAEVNPRQANATYLSRRERRYNRIARLGATVTHRPSDQWEMSAMVFASPKFLQRSERGTFRDFTRYHVGGSATVSATTRLTEMRTSQFIAGTDYAYQDGAILFYSLTPEGERGTELRDNKREGAQNAGVFAQEALSLSDAVTVTLGARYDHISYLSDSYITPSLNARKTFTGLTPKLGFSYRLSPAHTLYANVGGGVEVPAGNETDPAGTFGQDTVTAINPLLDPIRSYTFEVGTKHFVARSIGVIQAFSYDLALYNTEVHNEIVPYRGGRFYFTAGRARRQGAELGLSAYGAGGVTLHGALTFSRNRYVQYQVDSVHYGKPGAIADFSGHDVVGIPGVMANVALAIAPTAWRGVRMEAGVQGIGRYFVDDANQVVVPGYGIVNATLSFGEARSVGAGIGLQGFVSLNNVFNRGYIGSAFLNPDVVGGAPVAFEPGLARNLVVSLSLVRLPE